MSPVATLKDEGSAGGGGGGGGMWAASRVGVPKQIRFLNCFQVNRMYIKCVVKDSSLIFNCCFFSQ